MIYTYKKISLFLNDNYKFLEKTMSKKFDTEYGKIKYFTTILKNNLRDYTQSKPEIIKQLNNEVIENKFVPRERKKSIDEYLAEME